MRHQQQPLPRASGFPSRCARRSGSTAASAAGRWVKRRASRSSSWAGDTEQPKAAA